jgi:hypothetical protein
VKRTQEPDKRNGCNIESDTRDRFESIRVEKEFRIQNL